MGFGGGVPILGKPDDDDKGTILWDKNITMIVDTMILRAMISMMWSPIMTTLTFWIDMRFGETFPVH